MLSTLVNPGYVLNAVCIDAVGLLADLLTRFTGTEPDLGRKYSELEYIFEVLVCVLVLNILRFYKYITSTSEYFSIYAVKNYLFVVNKIKLS